MGVYVYLIHKANPINATLPDGTKVKVHRMMYLFKPYHQSMFDEKNPNARWERIANRVATCWRGLLPTYCCHCEDDGTPHKDAVVYINPPSTYLNDYSDFYAKMCKDGKVGRLQKQGRKWVVVPYYEIDAFTGKTSPASAAPVVP